MPHENAAAAPGVTGANEATGESSVATTESIPETDASAILQQAGVPDEVVKALEGTASGPEGPTPRREGTEEAQREEGQKLEEQAEQPKAEEDEPGAPEEEGPEPEERAAEDEETEPEEPQGEQPKWFKKRVDKWARQKQRLQDEIDDLREQIEGKPKEAEAEPSRPEARTGDVLSNVKDFGELEKTVNAQRALRDWCLKNRDGTVLAAGTDQERVISPEQVADWLVDSTRVIEDAPKAAANLHRRAMDAQTRAQWHDLATTEWPELFDRESEVHKAAQTFLQQYPEINQNPNRDFLLGLMVEGWKPFQQRMLARQQGANGNGSEVRDQKSESIPEALKRKIPPIPKTAAPNPPRGSRHRSPQDDAAAAVERLAKEGGSQEAAMAAIAAIERQNAMSGDTKRMPAPV